jgi:hypothetical protein
MASGDPDETGAYARLPGLDIAVLHRGALGMDGAQVVVALRAVPSFRALGRPIGAPGPLLLWKGLGQAAWDSWLGCLASATMPPWIGRGD